MSKQWYLPPTYQSDTAKFFESAKSLLTEFAGGAFEPPPELVSSVKAHLGSPGEAKAALHQFYMLLSISNDDFDYSNNPRIQTTLTIALVVAWASTDSEKHYQAFRELTRCSSQIKSLWAEAASAVANKDDCFKSAILNLADMHFSDAESKLLKEEGADDKSPASLDDIWRGHSHENYSSTTESWPWISLLAKLAPSRLYDKLSTIRSSTLVNRILDSPEFNNYDLWKKITLQVPPCFKNDGTWNKKTLLPSLIRLGSSKIIHMAGSQDQPLETLEPHVKTLLTEFVETLAQRSDFNGLFKRWGTWLFLKYLDFPSGDSNRKILVDSEIIILALSEKVKTPFHCKVKKSLDTSWEPWVYQSMLALLHSNNPKQFTPLDIRHFIEEWILTPTEWDSLEGQRLRTHTRHYFTNRPGSYACRVLGHSIQLSDEFTKHWNEMWKGSVALREILEFRPALQVSKEWRPAEASHLMRTLVDIGLGILDCATHAQDQLNPKRLNETAKLFEALWAATTEMSSIDIYGDDFWLLMQQSLALRRIHWTVEATNSSEPNHHAHLDSVAKPSSHTMLKAISSNACSFVTLLPMLLQNNVTQRNIKDLLSQTGIDAAELAVTAAKYQKAPERKFRIPHHAMAIIKDISRNSGNFKQCSS